MHQTPIGDSAIQLHTADRVTHDTLRAARALADHLLARRPPTVRDVVAVYADVTVYFDPVERDAALAWLDRAIEMAGSAPTAPSDEPATHRIPVCHRGAFAPDLRAIADRIGRSPNDVIELFASQTYTVAAIGFLPGFAYLMGLNDTLHSPRLDTPRQRVGAGSVGIGGSQTGIYPCDSPGGWNIIGRTPLAMFNPARAPAAMLHHGDFVHFEPITAAEFDRWK